MLSFWRKKDIWFAQNINTKMTACTKKRKRKEKRPLSKDTAYKPGERCVIQLDSN